MSDMKKIEIPFTWTYDLPSIVFMQFQVDLARLNDESNSMSEYPCFCIDLKTGEILGAVCDYARVEDLRECTLDGLYDEHIHNEDTSSL